MSHFIVTNNPLIKDFCKDIVFVDGSYLDTLIKVRDLVHSGHELINHPLGASSGMFYSPYRSIVVGDKGTVNNQYHIETIENSIVNYKKHMGVRKPDQENANDYATIDKELLISALEEHDRLGSFYKN